MPLRPDVKPLIAIESDEEIAAAEEKKGESTKTAKPEEKAGEASKSDSGKSVAKADEADNKNAPINIASEGIEARSFRIPVAQGNFGRLAVNEKGQIVYGRVAARGEDDEEEGPRGGAIKLFDFSSKDKKEQTVVDGQAQFGITYDGKKLLVVAPGNKCWGRR